MSRDSDDDPYLDAESGVLINRLDIEWDWQLRTINISKGANQFAHYAHIRGAATPIFLQLAKENHLAELNALHPFRQGNERALVR
jgi:fido (protein-threonine AMPylation protein)